jgi:hypothetical protein
MNLKGGIELKDGKELKGGTGKLRLPVRARVTHSYVKEVWSA